MSVADPAEVLDPGVRRRVISDSVGFGLLGLYGLSFGAVAVANGLTLVQASALSVLTFTGGSQFALVGVLGGGGSGLAGVAAALMLGIRNGFYGMRLSPLLHLSGPRKFVAAQLVIDETTAMATAQQRPAAGRLAFWATGITLFLAWNISTILGAVAAGLVDPQVFGLDGVAGAAFLALLWPRLTTDAARLAALTSATVVVFATPVLPVGLPVLIGGFAGMAVGARALAAQEARETTVTLEDRPDPAGGEVP